MIRSAAAFLAFSASLAFLALFVPASVSAWTCFAEPCSVWCATPVGYQIGALPDGVDEATVIADVRRAFDDWEAVDCGAIAFAYEGRVPSLGATAPIIVEWLTEWPHSATTFSLTSPSWTMATGCIDDAAIEHNAADYRWGSASGDADVYSATLRSIGFAVGLGASTDPDAVMHLGGGRLRLGVDDEEGLCTLYGMGRRLCGRCTRDESCGGDDDLCVSYPSGARYCGVACPVGDECGDDEACIDVEGNMQCVRMIEGEQACVAAGSSDVCAPCETSDDCAGECIDLDGARVCLEACTSSGGCPAGQQCASPPSGARVCVVIGDAGPQSPCETGPLPDAGPPIGPGPDAAVDSAIPTDDAGTTSPDDDGGCGCDTAGRQGSPLPAPLFVVFAAVLFRLRRRGSRSLEPGRAPPVASLSLLLILLALAACDGGNDMDGGVDASADASTDSSSGGECGDFGTCFAPSVCIEDDAGEPTCSFDPLGAPTCAAIPEELAGALSVSGENPAHWYPPEDCIPVTYEAALEDAVPAITEAIATHQAVACNRLCLGAISSNEAPIDFNRGERRIHFRLGNDDDALTERVRIYQVFYGRTHMLFAGDIIVRPDVAGAITEREALGGLVVASGLFSGATPSVVNPPYDGPAELTDLDEAALCFLYGDPPACTYAP